MNVPGQLSRERRALVIALLVSAPIGAYCLAGAMLLLELKQPLRSWQFSTYYAYLSAYHDQFGLLLYKAAFVAALVMFLLVVVAARHQATRPLFGAAAFATERQIRTSGLLADDGIVVGRHGSRYLMYGGQQHVLLAAPTRAGKGVSFVVPNLLSWSHSAVILDIKQENWALTAGYRGAHGHDVFLFNPAPLDHRTHRYNPLDYIADDPAFRVNDIQKIAQMLYPDLPDIDPIWNASCRSLFLGTVLYLKETPDLPCTLGEVLRQHLTAEDSASRFQRLIASRGLLRPGEQPRDASAAAPLSRACVSALNDFISVKSENTRSGIKKTFTSRLELWLNPLIDAATAASDFDLRDLRSRRMSIYVGVNPGDLKRLQPLLNLFFQQVVDLHTRQLPTDNEALRYQVLLLMDEFTSLGRMDVLAQGISFIAGYNLRLAPIIQSISQLDQVYGKDARETFIRNHELKILFTPAEMADAQDLSLTLGDTTVKAKSRSRSIAIFATRDSASENVHDHKRPLMLPQELLDLSLTDAIIRIRGLRPIIAKKIRYYDDPTFTARLFTAPPAPKLDPRTYLATTPHSMMAVPVGPGATPAAEIATAGDSESAEPMTVPSAADEALRVALDLDFSDVDVDALDELDASERAALHERIYTAMSVAA